MHVLIRLSFPVDKPLAKMLKREINIVSWMVSMDMMPEDIARLPEHGERSLYHPEPGKEVWI